MKIKTKILVFLLTMIFVNSAIAQHHNTQTSTRNPKQLNYRNFVLPGPYFEMGLKLGAANSMTDIGSSRVGEQASLFDVYSRGIMPALSLYGRYHFGTEFAIKSTFTALMLKGNDRWSPEIEIVERGKSFSNTLYEFGLVGELYLPRNYTHPKQDFRFFWIDLYLFTGISAFYHDPEVRGPIIDEYDYEILNSEDVYSNYQLTIPLGAGTTLNLYNRWTIGFDFNFRYTFFDYLDGFRRPYSNRNDFFFTGNLNLGYIINSDPRRSNRIARDRIFRPKKGDRLFRKRNRR